MLKKFALASVFVLAMAAPALADPSACSAPLAPAPLDGGTATFDQLKAAAHDANLFMKASDEYQLCVTADLARDKAQAVKDKKPVDPQLQVISDAKAASAQALKEKVGAEWAATLAAYKAAHPDQKL